MIDSGSGGGGGGTDSGKVMVIQRISESVSAY